MADRRVDTSSGCTTKMVSIQPRQPEVQVRHSWYRWLLTGRKEVAAVVSEHEPVTASISLASLFSEIDRNLDDSGL